MSDNGISGLDFQWGDLDPGQDTEALWMDTQMGVDQLPQHAQCCKEINHSLNGLSDTEFGIAYDEDIQRLATLSGEIFTQTNLHQQNNSPMDNIRKLIAHVITSSSSLLEILISLRGTLEHQEAISTVRATALLAESDKRTLDTATTLQILTTYIRLTQLHYTLYKSIQALISPKASPPVSPTPDSAAPTPAAFPSLAIGGISLAQYSRFQLKFLLQICAHHLGEIEALLGLPAGFRVSNIEDGGREHSGILGGPGGATTFFVRAIMMSAGMPMKEIREILEHLRKALEGRISV